MESNRGAEDESECSKTSSGVKRKIPPHDAATRSGTDEEDVDGSTQSKMSEEARKLEEKRAYNRRNSARARQRVKDQMAELSQKVDHFRTLARELEENNEDLSSQIAALKEENAALRRVVTRQQPEGLQVRPWAGAPVGAHLGLMQALVPPAGHVAAVGAAHNLGSGVASQQLAGGSIGSQLHNLGHASFLSRHYLGNNNHVAANLAAGNAPDIGANLLLASMAGTTNAQQQQQQPAAAAAGNRGGSDDESQRALLFALLARNQNAADPNQPPR